MKKIFVILLLAAIGYYVTSAFQLIPFGENRIGDPTEENNVASYYMNNTKEKSQVANIVTAIVVNYRGFDTLGEVTVLFLATTGLGSILYRRRKKGEHPEVITKPASQLLQSGSKLIYPAILVLGAYVFIHGHLTPGGGFQGGAIIATGLLLMMMAYKDFEIRHNVLTWVESIAGITFVSLGLTGLIYGKTFLENFLPTGNINDVVSGGIIPTIYIAVGFKVAAELAGVLETLLSNKEND